MSEWNFIHENIHTKNSVFTAPDAHIHTYTSLLHIISIQPENKAENIRSVHMTGIGKENSSQCLSNKEQ